MIVNIQTNLLTIKNIKRAFKIIYFKKKKGINFENDILL